MLSGVVVIVVGLMVCWHEAVEIQFNEFYFLCELRERTPPLHVKELLG